MFHHTARYLDKGLNSAQQVVVPLRSEAGTADTLAGGVGCHPTSVRRLSSQCNQIVTTHLKNAGETENQAFRDNGCKTFENSGCKHLTDWCSYVLFTDPVFGPSVLLSPNDTVFLHLPRCLCSWRTLCPQRSDASKSRSPTRD